MQTVELKKIPLEAWDEDALKWEAIQRLGRSDEEGVVAQIDKRSLDARSKRPFYRIRINVFNTEEYQETPHFSEEFQDVARAQPIYIIGAGPAGYFAAMECISLGYKPIIIERGKDAQARRRDLRAIQQFGEVNPHSNYCFGEGGAGTYSDGKLYTRSHKRGNIFKAMKLLVEHGAKEDILIDAHPHIGSNKLPKIVANIRSSIESYGGEVRFDTYMTDLKWDGGGIDSIQVNGDEWIQDIKALILATGHSARDVYELLLEREVLIEPKPFALGVRIEHPQPIIDEIQYNQREREVGLPAASYKLVCQVKDRGVYSFCMCPGGLVVPAATAPGEIVVNGMSLSKRDSPYANSGTVVAVEEEDYQSFQKHGVLAGLAFQKSVEQKVFQAGDGSQKAPAQRLTDFVKGKISADLPDSSYIPGLWSAELGAVLPKGIHERLVKAIRQFDQKMKGYFTHEAVVIATESRTSSPVRIPRDRKTYMHLQVKGLFPSGEGAGYAGGIISAALDGQNVAKAAVRYLKENHL